MNEAFKIEDLDLVRRLLQHAGDRMFAQGAKVVASYADVRAVQYFVVHAVSCVECRGFYFGIIEGDAHGSPSHSTPPFGRP